ncbi:hypothetical protein AB4144_39250, partial [Rhizobiaceae sp. 2RAB30]
MFVAIPRRDNRITERRGLYCSAWPLVGFFVDFANVFRAQVVHHPFETTSSLHSGSNQFSTRQKQDTYFGAGGFFTSARQQG